MSLIRDLSCARSACREVSTGVSNYLTPAEYSIASEPRKNILLRRCKCETRCSRRCTSCTPLQPHRRMTAFKLPPISLRLSSLEFDSFSSEPGRERRISSLKRQKPGIDRQSVNPLFWKRKSPILIKKMWLLGNAGFLTESLELVLHVYVAK